MTAVRFVSLVCDAPETIDGTTYDCGSRVEGDTTTSTRAEARARGWRVAQAGGRDLCRRHRDDTSTHRWGDGE